QAAWLPLPHVQPQLTSPLVTHPGHLFASRRCGATPGSRAAASARSRLLTKLQPQAMAGGGTDPEAVTGAAGHTVVGDAIAGQDASRRLEAFDSHGDTDDGSTRRQSIGRRKERNFARRQRECCRGGAEWST